MDAEFIEVPAEDREKTSDDTSPRYIKNLKQIKINMGTYAFQASRPLTIELSAFSARVKKKLG